MDYYETSQGAKVRVLLTYEELGFSAIDELCNKYREWLQISKEGGGRATRKTRAANRRNDQLYDEIMNFKLQPIKLKQISSMPQPVQNAPPSRAHSADTSMDTDSDSSSSRPITRSLRSRTPTNANTHQQQNKRPITTPCTPTHQRIRAHMKQAPSSGALGSSSVLGTALAQGHPKVSCTKIKQLLKVSDSAQKKRDEEKERQARLMSERRAKEERAEAQKRALLEERAENAKQNREKRLNHAAELRKAREEAKLQQKLRQQEEKTTKIPEKALKAPIPEVVEPEVVQPQPQPPVQKLNETFKKPVEEVNNINISIQDETNDEIQKEKIPPTAIWTRAPHLREALISQFSKSDEERHQEVLKVFPSVQLPVDLESIFGSSKAVNTRYLCRTSSAVWSPPNRAIKRSSSMVATPTNN